MVLSHKSRLQLRSAPVRQGQSSSFDDLQSVANQKSVFGIDRPVWQGKCGVLSLEGIRTRPWEAEVGR